MIRYFVLTLNPSASIIPIVPIVPIVPYLLSNKIHYNNILVMIFAFLKYIFALFFVAGSAIFGNGVMNYIYDKLYDEDFFLKKYLLFIGINPTKDFYPLYSNNISRADYSEGKKDVLVFSKLYDERDWSVPYTDDELEMKVDLSSDGENSFKYNIVFGPIAVATNNQVCGKMTSPQITNHAEMLDSEDPETYLITRKDLHQKIYKQIKSTSTLCKTIDYNSSRGLIIEDHGFGSHCLKSRIIFGINDNDIKFSFSLTQTFDGLEVQSLSNLNKRIKKIELNDRILHKIVYYAKPNFFDKMKSEFKKEEYAVLTIEYETEKINLNI